MAGWVKKEQGQRVPEKKGGKEGDGVTCRLNWNYVRTETLLKDERAIKRSGRYEGEGRVGEPKTSAAGSPIDTEGGIKGTGEVVRNKEKKGKSVTRREQRLKGSGKRKGEGRGGGV